MRDAGKGRSDGRGRDAGLRGKLEKKRKEKGRKEKKEGKKEKQRKERREGEVGRPWLGRWSPTAAGVGRRRWPKLQTQAI